MVEALHSTSKTPSDLPVNGQSRRDFVGSARHFSVGHAPQTWATCAFLLIAWIGCYFPWTSTTGTAFSVNLFDLAEWTSLDPAIRGGNPALFATFLLRMTVGLIAVAIAIKANNISNRLVRWGFWIVSLLIGIGLLPPLDFFRGAFDDPNYRQQFMIALITVIGIGASIFVGRHRTDRRLGWVGINAGALALLFGISGAILAIHALSAFGLKFAPGIGLIATTVALAGAVILSGIQAVRHTS